MRKLGFAFAIAMMLAGNSARAEGWYEDDDTSTPRADDTHTPRGKGVHRGLYFHLELGAGGMRTSTTGAALKGGGGSFAIAFGGSLSENLVLGAEAWDIVTFNPTTDFGETLSQAAIVGWGPTLRAYIDPGGANMFLAVTPSLTRFTMALEDGSSLLASSSKLGFGGRVTVGKEWMRPNSRWGLGLLVQVVYSSNEFDGVGDPFGTFGGGVNFSLTRN